MSFNQFHLHPDILDGLDAMGFKEPTPIQKQAIPIIIKGKDLVACAQTGTGKTGAFIIPLLHKICSGNKQQLLNTIIITPTRELAVQIDQQLEGLSYFVNVTSLAVYGGGDGHSFAQEKKALTQGAEIIVATPGRLIQHLNLGYVKTDTLKHLILDEADRMLDMGFHDDIMRIIKKLPKKRQTLLFSATMPDKIRTLANNILTLPEHINIAPSKPADAILQAAYVLHEEQKLPLLKHLLKDKEDQSIIIFVASKSNAKSVTKDLQQAGISAKGIHSDLDQPERLQILRTFAARKTNVLIATDILARGIDIKNINLIINYDVPTQAEDYIHRIGRTARAGETGIALTLISKAHQRKFKRIEVLIEKEINKVPLPAHLGDAPEYNPRANKKPYRYSKKSGGKKRKSYGKNYNGKNKRGNNYNKNKGNKSNNKNRKPPRGK